MPSFRWAASSASAVTSSRCRSTASKLARIASCCRVLHATSSVAFPSSNIIEGCTRWRRGAPVLSRRTEQVTRSRWEHGIDLFVDCLTAWPVFRRSPARTFDVQFLIPARELPTGFDEIDLAFSSAVHASPSRPPIPRHMMHDPFANEMDHRLAGLFRPVSRTTPATSCRARPGSTMPSIRTTPSIGQHGAKMNSRPISVIAGSMSASGDDPAHGADRRRPQVYAEQTTAVSGAGA